MIKRVVRGGSWDDDQDPARSSFRDRYNPSLRSGDIGFRVLCTSPPNKKAYKSLRGGSWVVLRNNVQSAKRNKGTPNLRSDLVGFRVLCS